MKCIIFSRDRACQLHACLETMAKFMPYVLPTVLYKADTDEFRRGYELLSQRFSANFVQEGDFRQDLIRLVSEGVGGSGVFDPAICFAVDDQIFRHRVYMRTIAAALKDPQCLCFSLRLGPQINYCYSCDIETPAPDFLPMFFCKDEYVKMWKWQVACKGDWGYPFSVDTTVYRTGSLIPIIQRHSFTNPNTFEAALAGDPVWRQWQKMACGIYPFTVNVPANRVQSVYKNRTCDGPTPESLNNAYLDGYQINTDPLISIENFACHCPMNYSLIQYVEPQYIG